MYTFSALIITHGREELLLKCLNSLRPQGLNWQLILVGNGSILSPEAKKLASELGASDVEFLELDSTHLPGAARNKGLDLVKGEWVFFLDDDAYLLRGYFDQILPYLTKEGIDVLGGPDTAAMNMTTLSTALAITLSSPFCSGKTSARHSSQGKLLRSVGEESLTSCNLWIRSYWLKSHKFPENYLRAEESALLVELKLAGAQLFYLPLLKVGHFRRKNIKDIWKATLNSGAYRAKLLNDYQTSGKLHYWLPTFFVLFHLLAVIDFAAFFYLFKMYLAVIVMMSLNLCARRGQVWLFGHVSFLHYFIVMSYGIGFLLKKVGLYAR